jgi:hypothetical protein
MQVHVFDKSISALNWNAALCRLVVVHVPATPAAHQHAGYSFVSPAQNY